MMRKLYQSFLSLLSGALLLSGCNAQEGPDGLQPDEGNLPPYSVTFRLGGSVAMDGASTRAEVQTTAEKELKSLYVVVFEDADGSGTGTTGTEDAGDKFYTAFSLDLTNYNQPQDPNLTFSLGKAGHFQVCFVANPSGHPEADGTASGLVAKINALTLGSSTVADFKNLLEESVLDAADAPSQYLMTSAFYTLATSYTQEQTIAEVTLTRAMARFDISNAADGYTITEVVFHNRAVKTPVITDAAAYVKDNVAETTSYTRLDLVGSSEKPSTYTEKIYSFPQFAGNGQDFDAGIEGLPYLEVKYKIPSLSASRIYSHNVYFKKAKAQPEDGYTVLPIKRNTLYKVKMTNDPNANLSFQITVLDWDKNTEIAVSDDDLVNNIPGVYPKDLADAAIGDYYMEDGTLRDGTKKLLEEDKAKVIGIVFQTYKDAPTRFEADMQTLGGSPLSTPHGLVMAVKNANNNEKCAWKTEETDELGLEYMETISKSYGDIKGLSNYNQVLKNDAVFSIHPAFKAVLEFSKSVSAPDNSTGWFLPSIGQWWDYVENLGGFGDVMDDYHSFEQPWITLWYSNTSPNSGVGDIKMQNVETTAQLKINEFLSVLGEGNYDKFVDDTWYWSSSEYSVTVARHVGFNSSHFVVGHGYTKTNTYYVRAVLAF